MPKNILTTTILAVAIIAIGALVYLGINQASKLPKTELPAPQKPPSAKTEINTSDWKTFTFNKVYTGRKGEIIPLKFSISYPSSWVVREYKEGTYTKWFSGDELVLQIAWNDPGVIYGKVYTCAKALKAGKCKKIGEAQTSDGHILEILKPDKERRTALKLPEKFLITSHLPDPSGKISLEFSTNFLDPEMFKKVISTFRFID